MQRLLLLEESERTRRAVPKGGEENKMITQKQIDKKREEFHRMGWDGNHTAQMLTNWIRRQERIQKEGSI